MRKISQRREPSDMNHHQEADRNTNKNRKQQFFRFFIAFVGVSCLATGVFLLARRPYIENKRVEKAMDIVESIQVGSVVVKVKTDDFEVEGEAYEDVYEVVDEYGEPIDFEHELFSLPDEVELRAVGTIGIESIDCLLPLWDEASVVSLRYGAGILDKELSAPGQDGNLVILGHRMKAYGSLFNRLGEMKLGDEIKIIVEDGTSYIYVVDEILEKLNPSELPTVIEPDIDDGKRVTLVTCTPTGVGSHRLIVIGHLAE